MPSIVEVENIKENANEKLLTKFRKIHANKIKTYNFIEFKVYQLRAHNTVHVMRHLFIDSIQSSASRNIWFVFEHL